MLPTLLVGVLATTWAWEALRVIIPWSLPSWLVPLIIFGIAFAFVYPDWHLAAGISGGAGVLHSLLTQSDPISVRIPRRTPPLP